MPVPKEAAGEAGADLARQVEVLKEELARLRREVERGTRRSASAARNVAAEGVEALKAQGEVAYGRMREGAGELEAEFARQVREKPVTSLAIAAGLGFLIAQILRR